MQKRVRTGVRLPRWCIAAELAGIALLSACYGEIKGYWLLSPELTSVLSIKIMLLVGVALLLPAALLLLARGANALNRLVLKNDPQQPAQDKKDNKL
ncbi:MAG: DUF1418 family protein [Enterobacteriaceae bacterium]